MSKEKEVKIPDLIQKGWEEVVLCAKLIRKGRGKIVNRTRKDGSMYRFTKIR